MLISSISFVLKNNDLLLVLLKINYKFYGDPLIYFLISHLKISEIF